MQRGSLVVLHSQRRAVVRLLFLHLRFSFCVSPLWFVTFFKLCSSRQKDHMQNWCAAGGHGSQLFIRWQRAAIMHDQRAQCIAPHGCQLDRFA
jgi:hypothetical protein